MPQLPFTFQSHVRPDKGAKAEPNKAKSKPNKANAEPNQAKAAVTSAPTAAQAPAQPNEAPAEAARTVYTVNQLQRRLRGQLERSYTRIWVSGEISNYSRNASSGHAYFTLKDRQASLSVVMFSDHVSRLRFTPKDGLEVLTEGTVTIWPKGGRLQLSATAIEPQGLGALQQEFEERVAMLRAEGLTARQRKRSIPKHPNIIGVVTSRGSAAMKDILRTLLRRNPKVHLRLCHSPVQGRGAATHIAAAVRTLDTYGDCDVILVARGGGSTEDLWAFNEEAVARAIAESQTPVITGVGHETDTSIADLVSDLRASTPTAAAEHATPVRREVVQALDARQLRLHRAVDRHLHHYGRRLERLQARLPKPQTLLQPNMQSLDELGLRMDRAVQRKAQSAERRLRPLEERLQAARPEARVGQMRRRFEALQLRLEHAGAPRRLRLHAAELAALEGRLNRALTPESLSPHHARLKNLEHRAEVACSGRLRTLQARLRMTVARAESLSPMAVLARGYALASRDDGTLIKASASVREGDTIIVRLHEGGVRAEVREILTPEQVPDEG